MDQAVVHLATGLANIRTGRATPGALLTTPSAPCA